MKVWLIKIGEPIPIVDGPHGRWMRTGLFGQTLAARGHEVLWWTSAFEHARNQHRCREDKVIEAGERYRIYLMRARGYSRARSIGRIIDHVRIARHFRERAKTEPRPDIIVCGMPTPGLALAATDYGREHGVPVVLDMRDMWPECFVWSAPLPARPLVYLGCIPAFRALRKASQAADAIIGITRPFVEWGLQCAGRAGGPLDRDFPLAYSERSPEPKAIEESQKFWAQRGITQDAGRFIACFFGYLGHDFDIETVIAAAGLLEREGLPMTFVLCGTGGSFEKYQRLAAGIPSVHLPGWMNFAQIWTLMRISAVGLAPYFNTKSFCASIPNKAIEYFSGRLPVVSSLQGLLVELLRENRCGVSYEVGRPDQLAAALRDLQGQPAGLRQMAENARALFEKRFVAEKVYSEMADYLDEVIAAYRARQ